MLKPGGTLVYCTCSLEPEEGEAHVAPLLARQPLALQPIAADEVGGLTETIAPGGTLRTLPVHLLNPVARLSGLDGFFAARFVKRG
jgi:16S rRNA (cytosine967-C5)-methyltransferase